MGESSVHDGALSHILRRSAEAGEMQQSSTVAMMKRKHLHMDRKEVIQREHTWRVTRAFSHKPHCDIRCISRKPHCDLRCIADTGTYIRIQVVHGHVYDRSRMWIDGRYHLERICAHWVSGGPEAIHVNVVVRVELCKELWPELCVERGWKVPQRIRQRNPLGIHENMPVYATHSNV